eukprot:365608-Chlamydomonas_euryale.AAC.28
MSARSRAHSVCRGREGWGICAPHTICNILACVAARSARRARPQSGCRPPAACFVNFFGADVAGPATGSRGKPNWCKHAQAWAAQRKADQPGTPAWMHTKGAWICKCPGLDAQMLSWVLVRCTRRCCKGC